ncbi:MAG: phytoene desaturase family protein [Polyangiales bacterium]
MSSSYYDVVVLGTDLAPLTCAALLAKQGFRVAVLGQQTERADYALGPYRVPRRPFTLTGSHAPLARRIFAELGLSQSLRRMSRALEPSFQVALPKHRFDMAASETALEPQIEREFPEVKRPILDFCRHAEARARATDALFERELVFPPESLRERRELARLAARLELGRDGSGGKLLSELADAHPFRAAVLGPVAFAANCDPSAVTELQLSRLWSARCGDGLVLDRGMAALADLLLQKIRAHSGQVRLLERASHIEIRRSGVAAVRLFGSDEEVGTANVIAGVDVASVQRLLSDRSPFEEMFERLGEPQPRFYRYTLNAVIGAAGVPEGMKRDVFRVGDADKPLQAENLLHIERSALGDGNELLCVEALLPARWVEEPDGSLDEVRERVVGALAAVVPFLHEHLLLLDSPHDGRKPWARDPSLLPGTEPPERRGPRTMSAVHAFPVTTALSVCAMPVRTPLRGLLLANQQVAPGLGLEGELLAASSAAQLVTRSDRARAFLRRRLWTKVEI